VQFGIKTFGRDKRAWFRAIVWPRIAYLPLAVAAILIAPMAIAQQVPILGETFAHDPSPLVKDGSSYYYYSTGQGILARSSSDMSHWSDGPAIFSTPPAWTTQAVPGFTGTFWAPDVEYFNGLYHLYYAVSTFGSQVSAIGMATSPTLNPSSSSYAWTDHGPVIESNNGYAYNTIDPSVVTRPDGTMWMSFGSYWDGIYQTQLNTTTGMLLNPNATPIHLAQRSGSDTSIEASYQYYRNGYYYLFDNWGSCCQGVNSTYNVRIGRSTSVNGPFVDQSGVSLLNGGGTLFLSAEGNYIGPGQVGIYSQNGQDYVSYHYYNGANNGTAAYALQNLYWTTDNWPTTFQPLVWSASTSGAARDGGGTWDLTHSNFIYAATNQAWNNSGYANVTFGSGTGTAGTVTLAQSVNVAAITFNPATSGNYTISGGTLVTSGPNVSGLAITPNVAATIQSPISGTGSLVVIGTGALLLGGTSSYTGSTAISGGANLTIGGRISGTSNLFVQQGTATIAAGGSVTTSNYSSIGQSTGNNGTLNISGALTVNNDFNTGDNGTGVTNLLPGGSAKAVTLYVGKFGATGGTLTQSGGTLSGLGGGGEWRIGGSGGTADAAAVGLYNLQAGLLSTSNNFQVGAYGQGTLKQTGGSAVIGGWVSIGRFGGGVGRYDMSSGSGTLVATGVPYLIVGEQGTGTMLVGGSSKVTANAIGIGYNGGSGTLTQTGGTIHAGSGVVFGVDGNGGTGMYQLQGGLLLAASLSQTSGTATFIFSGGTLENTPGGGLNVGMPINLAGQGTVAVDSGRTATFQGAATISGAGGLTKAGGGTLILSGTDTYTGETKVLGGTLLVTSPSGLANGSNLYIGTASSFFAPAVPSSDDAPLHDSVPEAGTFPQLVAALLATNIIVRIARNRHFSAQYWFAGPKRTI
jgi:autotransporter-associated beta strand protein